MRAKFIYEKIVEDSDPIEDMGIGQPKWEVVFDDLFDEDVVVDQKFYTRKEAQKFVDDCEYNYEDITSDNDGNDVWKTFYRWYNPEDDGQYKSYNIKMI